ncbi:hypothetical protein OZN48_09940 [Chryseobacterium indologenes]|jgi:hypothetical protein|uniref:hypothetical protein n=1 Tax=Chryseobacterium indologenes TaxID=253 RepID=UPI000F505A88|nr:hypothetical protein [Chryseobacterium indologenes]MEB4760808.1 hypothetical protein [Chryseobacterium indologenes]
MKKKTIRMMRKAIMIVLTTMIVVPNLPFIGKDISHRLDEGYFRYSNLDGSYQITQDFHFKSPGFETFGFEQWIKRTSPSEENRKLYRLYKINPLCFWRWSNYLRHGVHFDYMDPSVIEQNMDKKKVYTNKVM